MHAVEHVHAARDRLQQVFGRADPHQVARPIGRQQRRDLARRSRASPPAARPPRGRRWRSRESRYRPAPARWRAAARVRRRPARCRIARARAAPARTHACSARAQASESRTPRSISASDAGSFTHSSSCMTMSAPSSVWISTARSGVSSCDRAVEVGAECHALVLDLAQARERHHLEAAGIGKDRQRPVHEAMQAAERGDTLGARPQHQVIGVGEHDVGARRPHLIRIHALHGRLGADRHERRRAHPSVRGRDLAQPRGAVGRQQFEEKAGRHRKEC